MLGLLVSVPVACWRKPHAREFLETEALPPPSTCYGFLLSLVGEEDRERHRGVRITAGLVTRGEKSAVLRTLWRVKDRKVAPGVGTNARPDYQELATGTVLTIWVDSETEPSGANGLEARVRTALEHPETIDRFGGLSLGESTHLVDEVRILPSEAPEAETFVLDERGSLTLPVWVDHVGSAGTRYVVGSLRRLSVPEKEMLAPIG